jgi:tetratricopeptide (TPR) repeat protein
MFFDRTIPWLPRRRRLRVLFPVLLLLGATLGGVHGWAAWNARAAREAFADRRYDDARSHLQHCLWAWPGSLPIRLLAARIERLDSRFDRAEQYLRECKNLAGETTVDIQVEEHLLWAQQGAADRVFPFLWRQVEAGNPDAPAILETLALVFMQGTRFRPALLVLDRWVQLQPDTVRALDWRSLARLRTQQLPLAAADCEAVLRLESAHLHARLRLCDILLDTRQFTLAEGHLEYLRDHYPECVEGLVGLARCRIDSGRFVEGRLLLEQALAEHPGNGRALECRGELELEAGAAREAEPWLRQALAKAPADLQVLNLLHRCLMQLPGRDSESAEVFERYQSLRGVYERAAYLLAQEIDGTNPRSDVAAELAELLLQLDASAQALHWLQVALDANPHSFKVHRAAVAYYEKVNQPAKVAEHRQILQGLTAVGNISR